METQDRSGIVSVGLTGGDVEPDQITIGKLHRFLQTVGRILDGAVSDADSPEATIKLDISLTNVRPGSAMYDLSSPNRPASLRRGVDRTVNMITADDFRDAPPPMLAGLVDLTRFLRTQNLDAIFELGRTRRAILRRDTQVMPPDTMVGRTTVYGELIDIGGNDPSAKLKLLSDQTIICSFKGKRSVKRHMARELAKRLYTHVGVEGIGYWSVKYNELFAFEIERVNEYEDAPVTQAFDALRSLVGDRFRGISGAEYVRQIRDEEDE